MKKHNANNERTKRNYFTYLKEAKRQNESSVDAVAMVRILNNLNTDSGRT
jgi:hypothetical protein